MSHFELFVVTAGMTAITLLSRGFFMLRRDPWPMPAWLTEGLRYAPLAAMVAVVAPEVVLTHGHFVQTWKDPRLFGAAAATAWFFWRRDMLGTIVVGTGVLLTLRLGLGW